MLILHTQRPRVTTFPHPCLNGIHSIQIRLHVLTEQINRFTKIKHEKGLLCLHIGPSSNKLSNAHAPVVPSVAQS